MTSSNSISVSVWIDFSIDFACLLFKEQRFKSRKFCSNFHLSLHLNLSFLSAPTSLVCSTESFLTIS